MPKDQKIIEFVMAQCNNVSLEQEAKTVQSYPSASLNEHTHNPLLVEYLHNWPPHFHHLSCIPSLQSHPPLTQRSNYPSFKGSSNLSNESPSFHSSPDNLSPDASLNQSFGIFLGSDKPKYCENFSKQHMIQNGNAKVIQKPAKERYQSKNLILERNRRNRIKDGLYALRALVPKISKMNRVAILGDAIEYIEELQKTEKELQDELKEREEEECKKDSAESRVHGCSRYPPTAKHNQGSSSVSEKKQMEVQVEVKQIGTREFLLKFFCEQKQGGFTRLLEAMNSLGVLVVDANVTTFNGNVLNVLKAECSTVSLDQEAEIVQGYNDASLNEHTLNPFLVEHISFIPRLQFLPPITQPSSYPSFQGSSTTYNPAKENPSFDSGSDNLSPQTYLNQSIDKSLGSYKA
nr:basic helix-loop-helix transcription factor [Loropetalum chinense var. rubrum]